MPYAPARACPCGGRIKEGKCDRCGPRRSKDTRKHAAARGYNWQWQKFRLSYLARNPLCMDCTAEGRVGAATDVHHKEKLRDRPDLKYEESNLLALCGMHHDVRTARGE